MEKIELENDVPLLPVRRLKAGALSCMYEHGNLRYIHCGETEVIRMIYGAVRNQSWETAGYTLSDEVVRELPTGFQISYTARYQLRELQYEARYLIEGRSDSSLVFSMEGKALSAFRSNRIGICVLHPVDTCAGREATVTRPDRSEYSDAFPFLVHPHQPFFDMQKIRWHTASGVSAEIQFEGDVFEMEDQRNWSDHSYKTYSTPLSVPFPVEVLAGDEVRQQVTVRVQVPDEPFVQASAVRAPERLAFPELGTCFSGEPLSGAQLEVLKQLPLQYYHVPLYLGNEAWERQLRQAAREAAVWGGRLQLAVFFTDEGSGERLLDGLAPVAGQVDSLLPLVATAPVTPADLFRKLYPAIKLRYPHIRVGFGTSGFFAELNRNLPVDVPVDFVCFGLNPAAHATDTRTIWENLGSHTWMLRTLQEKLPGVPIHVAPITFRTRFNPEARTNDPALAGRHIADERQHTRFAAMWTLLAIRNLAAASRLCFYEPFGPCGVLEGNKQFTTPLYQALQQLHQLGPMEVLRESSEQYQLVVENAQAMQLGYGCSDVFR